MTELSVSPEILRAKARALRTLLDERKAAHQNIWDQVTSVAGALPADVYASHEQANLPWNTAIETVYENYYELALSMEAAADAYEQEEKAIQDSMTS